MRASSSRFAVRHLGGAVQLEDVARRIVAADRAAGFHRHAGMAADREVECDDRMRLAESGLDVAVALAGEAGLGVAAG